jgi:hypothetical protein
MNPCRLTLVVFTIFLLTSCSSSKPLPTKPTYGSQDFVEHTMLDNNTFKLSEVSTDASYGYTEANPIKVGFKDKAGGPTQERQFLNALLGPNGETVTFTRQGSCCHFKTKNSAFNDMGLLDIYEVTYQGLTEPIKLYVNMYDGGPLKAPKGFTFRQ